MRGIVVAGVRTFLHTCEPCSRLHPMERSLRAALSGCHRGSFSISAAISRLKASSARLWAATSAA
jgi:hypothetical protein